MSFLHKLSLLLVFGLIFMLRFLYIGYSDLIPIETKVLEPIKSLQLGLLDGESPRPFSFDFFMAQSTGPIQFLVALGINMLGVDVFNHFLYRLPFVVANVLGLYFFYLFIKSYTQNKWIALLSIVFLGFNGAIVGLGRVVQYQSFNILFSSIALWLYLKPHYKYTWLFGVFFGLSVLTHWDAIFILPILLVLQITRKDYRNKKWLILNLVSFLVVTLPFLVFYTANNLSTQGNQEAMKASMGFGVGNFDTLFERILSSANLYNPFLYNYVLLMGFILSLFFYKKTYPFLVWLIIDLLIFGIFIKNPTPHLYNLLFPMTVLSAWGYLELYNAVRRVDLLQFLLVAYLVLVSLFFFNQSNTLFADVLVEYPWEIETIYKYKTKEYMYTDLPANLVGFPIKRGWKEIRAHVGYHSKRDPAYGYITNEDQSVANFYLGDLDLEYGPLQRNYYAIGIKSPLSFVSDDTFPHIPNKHTVKRIRTGGATSARIYLVTPYAAQ